MINYIKKNLNLNQGVNKKKLKTKKFGHLKTNSFFFPNYILSGVFLVKKKQILFFYNQPHFTVCIPNKKSIFETHYSVNFS